MKHVNPSSDAIGGRFDPVSSPKGPLDKRANVPPASVVNPGGQPINYPNSVMDTGGDTGRNRGHNYDTY